MLFEGHLICQLYFMLDQNSFAQIYVIVHKQVLPFEQQLLSLFLLWLRPFCETLEVQSLQDLLRLFQMSLW